MRPQIVSVLLSLLTVCGQPEDRCVLDGHPLATEGKVSRLADSCALEFVGSGQASSWIDLNGSSLKVYFVDSCKIGEMLRSVRLTDDDRKLTVFRSLDNSGVITMPSHPETVWMDVVVKVSGPCPTLAYFTAVR